MAVYALRHGPLRPVPGIYALLMMLDRPHSVVVGRRGRSHFPAGFYLYIGSALGPGGLARRVERHLRAEKRLHWHIDYFLRMAGARVTALWTVEGTAHRECEWARAAMQLPGASIIMPHFGSSDCHCAAHLIGFTEESAPPNPDHFSALVGGPVHRWGLDDVNLK